MKLIYLKGLIILVAFLFIGCEDIKNKPNNKEVPEAKDTTADQRYSKNTRNIESKLKLCYTPPIGVPVKFCLDENGKFSVNTAQEFVTPLGKIGVSGSASSSQKQDKLVIQINTPTEPYSYTIKENDQLKIKIGDGATFLSIENKKIKIDVKDNDKNPLVIHLQKTSKPLKENSGNLFHQFLGIKKGDVLSDIIQLFGEKVDIEKKQYNKLIKLAILKIPFNAKKVSKNYKAGTKLLTIMYKKATGEVIGLIAENSIDYFRNQYNLEDRKLSFFGLYRKEIKSYLSDFSIVKEEESEVVIINPKDCGTFDFTKSACFPRLIVETPEKFNYKCSRVKLLFSREALVDMKDILKSMPSLSPLQDYIIERIIKN